MSARSVGIVWCLAALWASARPALAGEETAVESKVVHVTVYPEWAYVTRQAAVKLEAGATRCAFKGLPAWIDEESMRARVEGAPGCRIAGVAARTAYLARSTEAEVRAAEDEVRALNDAIEDLNNELRAADEEKTYFSETRMWRTAQNPNEVVRRKISVEEFDAVRAFVVDGLLKTVKRMTELRHRIRDLQPELAAKQKALGDLRGRTRLEQKEIVVDLESPAAASATLSVSYLISGASWYPGYDARTDRDKSKIALACRAVVQQSTGEDWQDATFTLSTIQPYLTREKPELQPWYINASNARSLGLAVEPRADLAGSMGQRSSSPSRARMEYLQTKQAAGQDAAVQRALEDNVMRAQAVVRQVEERGVTVEFEIPGAYSVKADGKPVSMAVGQTDLTAALLYSAVPVVSRSTYVTGEMRNAGAFPFLPGETRIYVEGSFIGKSSIPCVAEGEKFELYLGLEERIKVTRELDGKKSSASRSGSRKRFVAAYRIEVTNFLKTPAAVEVRDQVPVSQDDRVKVRILSVEPRTDEPDKGIVAWRVELAPGEAKELRFEFQVDYPAGVFIGNASELERQIEAAQ